MSTISKNTKQYIEVFDFTGLFNQLGWSYLDEKTPVKLKRIYFIPLLKGRFQNFSFQNCKTS